MPGHANIIIAENAAQLAVKGVELFCRNARRGIERSGHVTVAISGGSTPRAMHRLLTREPYVSEICWQKIHLFWVDERLVPENDAASNYGAAREDFISAVPIPPEQVHSMTSEKMPEEAAAEYQRKLEACFGKGPEKFPRFDTIFLGVGQDGHTASIFPDDLTAETTDLPVVPVKGGNPDVYRLTLTVPVLNHAKCAVFIVSGREKAPTVKTLLTDESSQLPARKIQPVNGRLVWLLDREAAELIYELPGGA